MQIRKLRLKEVNDITKVSLVSWLNWDLTNPASLAPIPFLLTMCLTASGIIICGWFIAADKLPM